MDAADGGRREKRYGVLQGGYGLASVALIGLFPFLPRAWRAVDLLAVCAAAAASVAYGRRAVRPDRRRPWTLLLGALVVLVLANVAVLAPDDRVVAAGRLLDAAGNLLVLAAALTLIVRRGVSDLGGVMDAAVIGLAAGSLLWIVLPHRLGEDQSFAAQLNLFVGVFALTGVLGALLRLAPIAAQPGAALWWLLCAISLAIGSSVVESVAGTDPDLQTTAPMLSMAAFTAAGLFGLDPTGPRLVVPMAASPERLSAGRLAFLCVAVAAIPVAVGTRDLLAGDVTGVLLAVQGTLVAVLVMARIGLLSAQRARAQRVLEHQATHDPLTRLTNRREFVVRLREVLDGGARCVLLFCDLDDFKSINDRFGHDAGDALLIEVARRLLACVGPPHVVSRFGGDEFVVLLIDVTSAAGDASRDCITATLERPIEAAGNAGVRVSIGIADSDQNRDPEQLISAADRGMYRVKMTRRPAAPRGPVDRPPRPGISDVDGTPAGGG